MRLEEVNKMEKKDYRSLELKHTSNTTTIIELEFEDFKVQIIDSGAIFLSDYHAEHMIYLFPEQVKKILEHYEGK